MGRIIEGSAPELRMAWGSHNVWKAGQEHEGPVHAHTIWLLLYGHAQVSDGSRIWKVRSDHILLWPYNKHRHIRALSDSAWLSIGIAPNAPGQTDILRLLPLPATHLLEDDENRLLRSWFSQIVELREAQSLALLMDSPHYGNQDITQILGVRHDIVSQRPHEIWMEHVVAERASFYDIVEQGLAQAIVAWCWKIWGKGDLQHALLSQFPPWLQSTLERIGENPTLSVHDLARIAGFSPAHFRRLFHLNMGQSPRDYLQHQRLELARKLLETTSLPISAIATQTGFASVPHFTQKWKTAHGSPPHQYRLSHHRAETRNF